MPMTIHPSTGPNSVSAVAYPDAEDQTPWWLFLYGGETVKLNFSSYFNHGTFDRFPDLKVVILESGIGWLVWWLDRMDEKFEINGFTTPMKEIPSTYFKRQGFISMDPDERLAKLSIEILGADRFMWAYDFPTPTPSSTPSMSSRRTSETCRRKTSRRCSAGMPWSFTSWLPRPLLQSSTDRPASQSIGR